MLHSKYLSDFKTWEDSERRHSNSGCPVDKTVEGEVGVR